MTTNTAPDLETIYADETLSAMRNTLSTLQRMVEEVAREIKSAEADRNVFEHSRKIQDAVLWATWNCKLSDVTTAAARTTYYSGMKS